MAKLKKKEILTAEKEKTKLVTGKITKFKKITDVPQKRRPQTNLRSPTRTRQGNSTTTATPFSVNSMHKFTSTPMHFENVAQKENFYLKKLSSRLSLSPILKNICNINQNTQNQRKEKGGNVEILKENLPKNNTSGSRSNNENVDPNIQIATRRGSAKVRRIDPPCNMEILKENLPKISLKRCKTNNEHAEANNRIGTRSSVGVRRIDPAPKIARTLANDDIMVRDRLRKRISSVETLSSDSQSSKRTNTSSLQNSTISEKNESSRSYVFSDSSVSSATKVQPKHRKKITKVNLSDRSSTKEIATAGGIQKPDMRRKITEPHKTREQYKENNCSKLRVLSRRSSNDFNNTTVDTNTKRRKTDLENTLVKRLKSDWTDTTSEEIPPQYRTPQGNQIQSNQLNKRRLTPLVEMSVEDTIIPTASLKTTPKLTNRNTNDEEYSSSAEFQTDDEGENHSRSKRAPTWKDLLNKTKDSPNKHTLPETQLRRSPRLHSKIVKNSVPSPEKEVEKTKQKKKLNKVVNNCKAKSVEELKKPSKVNKKINEKPNKKKESNVVLSDVILKENNAIIENNDHVSVEDVRVNLPIFKLKKTSKVNKEKKADVTLKECNDIIENENQDPVQDISAEKTIPSSPFQNNHSEKPDTLKNTSSPPRCDESATTEIVDLTCPVKFFHSRLENTANATKPTESLKRRRSSRRKKQESIYEFLSQSSSESNNPVDDVIQKMIKTGKVVVAKHKKGTGKNVIPRKKANKPLKKKITKPEEINLHPTTKPLAAVKNPLVPENINDDYDDGLHFDDGFHFDDSEHEIPEKDKTRDQSGFSSLARSAMIKQAGRIQKPTQRKAITDKKKLLAMAMKFVNQSTPVRMRPQPPSEHQYSPMPGNKSPWRVDDDKLPNLFYLGRNSDNLPSFSSDYIPMTPIKNKSKSMSSFSSNDSNGENTAPPGAKILTNEANMQALTNTRKALTYRSPLKAINILEVVNLPPLALHSYGRKSNGENVSKDNLLEIPRSPTPTNTSNIFDGVSNNNLNDNTYHNSNNSKSDVSNGNEENQLKNTHNQNLNTSDGDVFNNNNNNNITDLFGFNELIDDDDNNTTNISVDKTILPNKDALKERLQRLKHLRPNQPVVISNKRKRIEPVFDNVGPKQKNIKQMLCSTMIDNQRNRDEGNQSFNATEDLFKDLDPETTFDDSNPRRTYNRTFKRKRKLLSDFAIIMDSDVSEDEEEAREKPVKNYKAKPSKRQKNNNELNKFVNDFNEMCKEVSQYELVVE